MRHRHYHDFVAEVVLVFVVLSLSLSFAINVVGCCRHCSFCYCHNCFYCVVCSSLFSASLCPRLAFLMWIVMGLVQGRLDSG